MQPAGFPQAALRPGPESWWSGRMRLSVAKGGQRGRSPIAKSLSGLHRADMGGQASVRRSNLQRARRAHRRGPARGWAAEGTGEVELSSAARNPLRSRHSPKRSCSGIVLCLWPEARNERDPEARGDSWWPMSSDTPASPGRTAPCGVCPRTLVDFRNRRRRRSRARPGERYAPFDDFRGDRRQGVSAIRFDEDLVRARAQGFFVHGRAVDVVSTTTGSWLSSNV